MKGCCVHSVGVGPDTALPIVPAAMAVRLNNILIGGPGVQADMTLLSHIGLAMLDEGEVDYQGRRMPAAEGWKAAGIEPLKPFGKDGLAIVSSNAYTAGLEAIAIHDAEQLLSTPRLVYALSLERLNGDISPLLEDVAKLRPFPSHLSATAELRTVLGGSYLWQADDKHIP